jgi:cytochrome c556
MKNKLLSVLILVLPLIGVGALAHSGATGIVKERMNSMKAMSNAVKAIKNELSGDGQVTVIKAHAKEIESHAGSAMTAMFPQGSRHDPSKARAAIWIDWAAFRRSAARLEIDAAALYQTPTMDAFKTMLAGCGSCHKHFRAKK